MEKFNIQGKMYRRERIRVKKESIIIIPKKEKKEKNAQIEILFFDISNRHIVTSASLFVEKWKNRFSEYSIFRVFYDDISSRVLISFNTPVALSTSDGEAILKVAIKMMEECLEKSNGLPQKNEMIETISEELDKQDILLKDLMKDSYSQNKSINKIESKIIENQEIEKRVKLGFLLDDDSKTQIVELNKKLTLLEEQLNEKSLKIQLLIKEKENLVIKLQKNKKIFNTINLKLEEQMRKNEISKTAVKKLQNTLNRNSKKIQEQKLQHDKIVNCYNELQNERDNTTKELQIQVNLKEKSITSSNDFQKKYNKTKGEVILEKKKNEKLTNTINELQVEIKKQIKLKEEAILLTKNLQEKNIQLDQKLKEQLALSDRIVKTSKNFQNTADKSKKRLQEQMELNVDNINTINELKTHLDKMKKEQQKQVELKVIAVNEKNDLRCCLDIANRESEKYKERNESIKNISDDKDREFSNNSEHDNTELEKNLSDKKQINRVSTTNCKHMGEKTSQSTENLSDITGNQIKKDSLTKEEISILELFNDFDISQSNRRVSVDLKRYNYYIQRLSYLPSAWQLFFKNEVVLDGNKFYQTFNTFIVELDSFLASLSFSTRSKFLNKRKVIIAIDDLKLIEAYETLSRYLSQT